MTFDKWTKVILKCNYDGTGCYRSGHKEVFAKVRCRQYAEMMDETYNNKDLRRYFTIAVK